MRATTALGFARVREGEAPGYRQATFVSDCRAGDVVFWTNADLVAVGKDPSWRGGLAGVAVRDQLVGEIGLVQVRGFTPQLPAESTPEEPGEWPVLYMPLGRRREP